MEDDTDYQEYRYSYQYLEDNHPDDPLVILRSIKRLANEPYRNKLILFPCNSLLLEDIYTEKSLDEDDEYRRGLTLLAITNEKYLSPLAGETEHVRRLDDDDIEYFATNRKTFGKYLNYELIGKLDDFYWELRELSSDCRRTFHRVQNRRARTVIGISEEKLLEDLQTIDKMIYELIAIAIKAKFHAEHGVHFTGDISKKDILDYKSETETAPGRRNYEIGTICGEKKLLRVHDLPPETSEWYSREYPKFFHMKRMLHMKLDSMEQIPREQANRRGLDSTYAAMERDIALGGAK